MSDQMTTKRGRSLTTLATVRACGVRGVLNVGRCGGY
ncbi:hypothetical protein ERO13_D04G046966v2 [Gossypium hirsutum]|nr:hypothetical protein ERO13_D04G046966v2 [Gossypium hirsutum]